MTYSTDVMLAIRWRVSSSPSWWPLVYVSGDSQGSHTHTKTKRGVEKRVVRQRQRFPCSFEATWSWNWVPPFAQTPLFQSGNSQGSHTHIHHKSCWNWPPPWHTYDGTLPTARLVLLRDNARHSDDEDDTDQEDERGVELPPFASVKRSSVILHVTILSLRILISEFL